MYHVKSNAVWYSLPGVEAVFQPIGAPDLQSSLQNIGMTDALGHRLAGRYTATVGVVPAFNAARGWTFTGSEYLTTTLFHGNNFSMISSFSGVTTSGDQVIAGCNASPKYLGLELDFAGNKVYYSNGTYVGVAPAVTSGVLGVAKNGYRNGVVDSANLSALGANQYISIGMATAGPSNRLKGTIRNLVIASRLFTPDEMWLASQQMTYCEVNPAWNAWARRRYYYYAPTVAGRVGIYDRRGAVALPGGVSIRSTGNG